MSDAASLIPEITDEDIDWVRDLMQLTVLDAPRRAFLTSRNTLDVSACPGSGKTTLIVAKLAILARKWPHAKKGICVLSHTNVAREEIQRRLGSTVAGQRLLGYPHFIDTIHSFVNRFLALPWLNSNGYPSPTIDNDVTTAYRRGLIGEQKYWKVQNFLKNKNNDFDQLRICARDLTFDLGGKVFPARADTESFSLAKQAIEAAARAGYFCYDEMFVWARALVEDFPDVTSWLRHRYPLVILDEMQDTFELQGTMLHTIFPRTSPDIVVQRVGDPNQAIFDNSDADPNNSDPFPDPDHARCLGIPNSHRFGPGIAALASPFAVKPVSASGLCGIGPKAIADAPTTCVHAIFVFPDNSTAGVLDVYGKHVLATFADHAMVNGVVTAVGAVHRDASDILPGHAQYPKSVPHYWIGYTAEIARREPHPKSFIQYVRAAQSAVRDARNLSPGVEEIASGLIRLAGCVGDAGLLKRKSRTHRVIVEALTASTAALTAYRTLLKKILIDRMPLTQAKWDQVRDDLLAIACSLCEGTTKQANAMNFLAWSTDAPSVEPSIPSSPSDAGANVYRVEHGARHVDIRLGSIHSVKGQTHLATMLLDTYWYAHSSKQMLPWLLGTNANEGGAGVRDRTRLLQTYVAMTRPTHLLCLAIPRSILGDDAEMARHVATLTGRGWSVGEIVDGAEVGWLGEWRG